MNIAVIIAKMTSAFDMRVDRIGVSRDNIYLLQGPNGPTFKYGIGGRPYRTSAMHKSYICDHTLEYSGVPFARFNSLQICSERLNQVFAALI